MKCCIMNSLFSPPLSFLFLSVFLPLNCHLLLSLLAVGIYSIWFYDKSDCQRIAQLMVR